MANRDSQLYGYKLTILSQLQIRNANEKHGYSEILQLINYLFDTLDFHQKENLRLKLQRASLEQDVSENQKNETTGLGSSKSSERTLLERKIFQMQEELTELHRKKGEYAQQVIDLRSLLDEKENEIISKHSLIKELEESLTLSQMNSKRLQQKLTETDHSLQFVKDEYDALLITYSCLEEKKMKLERENQDLILRVINIKAEDADRMNKETEDHRRSKEEMLQRQLADAAREPRTLDPERIKVAVCLDAILPRKVMHRFDAHDGEVNAVAWCQNVSKFATAGGDRKVKVWEICQGQPTLRGVARESNSAVYSIVFDSEETLMLGASGDFASRVWTINDLKIRHTLTGHTNKVMSAKFLGESSKVVSGSHDRTLKIWDLRRRACTRTILAGSSCNDVIERSGTDIVSGHFDKKIRFWDIRSDSSTNEILLQGKITSLDLSADGFSLLSCVRDDTLKLIDFRMHNIVKTFSADGFLIGCDWTRAKFSPDGKHCVCGSQDGSVFIWSLSSGLVENTLKEHNSTVICCAWSLCGNYIISCDKNKKAILWTEF